MNQFACLTLLLMLMVACAPSEPTKEFLPDSEQGLVDTTFFAQTDQYQIMRPARHKALLITFPGGGHTSVQTKQEFQVEATAEKSGVAVLYMNFNLHLWVSEDECAMLAQQIEEAVKSYGLNTDRVFIGGMSMGGNVALTLSNYLLRAGHSIQPKGTFIVDSPVDLHALYENALRDAGRSDFSEERKAEPEFIIRNLEKDFGSGDSLLTNIQSVSPYTLATQNIANLESLKSIKLNLYTEPDSLWWRENRDVDLAHTNSYVLQQLGRLLRENGYQQIQLIETEGKGYRANGDRHPHSWSIVDVNELMDWMLE